MYLSQWDSWLLDQVMIFLLLQRTGYGIETFFSEYYPDIVFSSFEERSNKILFCSIL